MPITDTSRHHSAQDPGGLIGEALAMGAEFPGPARDLLMSWILRLGPDQDPAAAARHLLAAYGLDRAPAPAGACGELIRLLRETAEYPGSRLRRLARRGRPRR